MKLNPVALNAFNRTSFYVLEKIDPSSLAGEQRVPLGEGKLPEWMPGRLNIQYKGQSSRQGPCVAYIFNVNTETGELKSVIDASTGKEPQWDEMLLTDNGFIQRGEAWLRALNAQIIKVAKGLGISLEN